VNARAVEFFAHEPGEFRELGVTDVISGADESLVGTLWTNLENERYTLIEAYCVRADGSLFPAEIAVSKLDLGTVHLCLFIRDITIRRQAEEMLRTEHSALQTSGNGIGVTNVEGVLEYVNPAVARMWGFEGQDRIHGLDVRDLFADREEAGGLIEALLKGAGCWTGEIKAQRRDGTVFDVQTAATCNRNAEGEQVGMVFSFVDISDRKRAEGAEREAERRRVMLESLGAACHYLSQPATVLMGNLNMMLKDLDGDRESLKKRLESSVGAVESIGEILQRLHAVNEYKTTQYLETDGAADAVDSRILDI
jgi:PAS domain S-box-containing protein